MGIVLAILFILQIISFMIITLLYMKIAKFNNLEKKQQKLMQEMDQSVMAYLVEIKEENDRLIEQLNGRMDSKREPEASPSSVFKAESAAIQEKNLQKPHSVPVNFAIRSYQESAATTDQQEMKPLDDRDKAKQLRAQGKSVQEIAKELGKGQTEIELLLKFG
ncbi:helix-turn-helix domain-containing protein [Sporosarcina obsidiansis]|uniref:hypothetical protein n=1 Tax=Sporosarcina obsidiansis TaxID=2660748 RepID=UPI00129B2FD9|nr:hypothetical protein [Sporosarcina obsidiansis]